ncbi:hypothetical protein MMC22_004916 [Lobaria immixta]|nr:hypothetical protein [Lobaria immixta]
MKLTNFYTSLAALLFLFSHVIAAPQAQEKRDTTSSGVLTDKIPEDKIDLTYFSKLPSHTTLKWVSCYDHYYCSRLTVPLDYNKPHGDKVQLALVKYPAKKHLKYKGSLYLQIGLGVSATNLVLGYGPDFQVPTLEGYDIIGWDVRGVGQSTPFLTCFPDEKARQAYANSAPKVLGDPSVSLHKGIEQNLHHAKVLGQACKERSGKFLPYIDTVHNAKDLHTIMKATGAKKVDAFWGYHYATLLGETYAALYPHEFDQLILDGVVDGEKQYDEGDFGPSSILGAEKAVQAFFNTCSGAGPAGCPFYEPTPQLVKKRYQKLEAQLIKSPVSVPKGHFFDYSVLHNLLAGAVTAPGEPFYLYPFLAGVLQEAENRTAGPNLEGLFSVGLTPTPSTGTDGSFEYSNAIQCLDADPYRINHPDEFIPYLKSMLKTSPSIGFQVAQMKLSCAGWIVPAAENFCGKGKFNLNTRGKVLFVGNTADPYVPLENAEIMSHKFKNSRVLTLNAVGFSSLPFKSDCRVKVVENFLNHDLYPAPGTVCQEDNPPFGVPLGDLQPTH